MRRYLETLLGSKIRLSHVFKQGPTHRVAGPKGQRKTHYQIHYQRTIQVHQNQAYFTPDWADEVVGDCELKRYRMDLLSLDEIAEVERLADLVKVIRSGNPPGYYATMRDAEVKGASLYFSTAVKQGLRNRKPYHGLAQTWAANIHFTDFSTETLESAYDAHQIKLISARIIRITATAIESDDENISDGPSGQGTP